MMPSAQATPFSQHLDAGGWRAELSVFACELRHQIPYYGEAVFKTRAGENSQFMLRSDSSRLASGKASLVARTPVWLDQQRQIDLGHISVTQGLTPIQLASGPTERMLSELLHGLELVITRSPWYGSEESARLAITTIGFRAVYQQYQDCLAGLLPVNFDQIKRTAVYFGSAQYEDLAPSELQKLDHIALYVRSDPLVKEFYIDGHTDSVGTRADNLILAERRAEEVVRYLVHRGVPEELIVTRWHGQRYPVASNETVIGRAQNRRVTIRMERLDPPPQALR